ncbi:MULTISPECIES: ECF transporter S component [unclassified Arthrobacter]|uniref:ECF transporter S component n=1 Tax=unclassified Arthrobacter TaxID=235627 RepID=UPI001D15ADD8|nr:MULTISPECIES: ECF transporter S component [unclassified Arthrobacter]MCC3290012.1 ECF transporter S component [Arthrobacter sp. zg-Y1110]MCC3300476.1 ECF transporter S component [Arthrobacter sp. zg-Y895]UWX84587.1 ECF transporter S component [Arthrobacter sp. zg-Y1110]
MKDQSAAPHRTRTAAPRRSWRVVDIVVASVLAVAVGVIFWAWSLGYAGISVLTAAFPPLAGLYTGGWLIAGVLGGLIIRKPGAAIYCEMLASAVSGVLGTQFGLSVLLSGFLQGLGAELVFLLFLYRRFSLPVALLAGLGSGLFLGLSENVLYNVEWAAQWQLLYVLLTCVSGAVIAGGLSWLAVRALARTGALAPFASGRTGTA